MKRIFLLFVIFLTTFHFSFSQDEGVINKRERIAKDKGIFFNAGPSFTLGKNIGDYSAGFNLELGFVKRLNRVFSIGPSISYVQFNYDPEKTGLNNIFIGGPYDTEDGNGSFYLGAIIDFTGGNVALTSLAVNMKLNFVPVRDASKVSVYGFVKPFISHVSRTKVTGEALILANEGDPYNAADWESLFNIPWETDPELGVEVSDKLQQGTEVTGGIFLGPGIEFNPARALSFYAQASFGYTFPITFVSTKSYSEETFESLGGEFPMIKKGFPSVNVQLGVSFNF
jgi:hypothetical protein